MKGLLRASLLLPAALGLASAAPAAEDWMLAAREGGCHPISSLRRKLPELPDVRTPAALEAWLRTRGFALTRRDHGPEAVELEVPAAGLHLMLVPARRCQAAPR